MVSAYLVPALVVATQLTLGQPPPGREGGTLQQEGSSPHTEGAHTHTEGHPHFTQRGHPHLTQRGTQTSHRGKPTPHTGPAIRAGPPGTSPENHLVCTPPHTHTHVLPWLPLGLATLPAHHQTSSSSSSRLARAPVVSSLILSLDTASRAPHGPLRPSNTPRPPPECPAPGRTCNNNNVPM